MATMGSTNMQETKYEATTTKMTRMMEGSVPKRTGMISWGILRKLNSSKTPVSKS